MTNYDFDDETIAAYLDGESDHVDSVAFEQWLESSPENQQRVEALSIPSALIKQSFDELLNAPQANRAPIVLNPVKTKWTNSIFFMPHFWQGAIAASMLLFAGLGATGLLYDAKSWKQEAAAYHALYAKETLANINPTLSSASTELDRVAQKLDIDLQLADVNTFSDLIYKRAQLLQFEDQPLAHLTFVTAKGDPIALCIFAVNDNEGDNVALEQRAGMNTAVWKDGKFEFLLIGGIDEQELEQAALHFKNTI